jgi:hypothetical protein
MRTRPGARGIRSLLPLLAAAGLLAAAWSASADEPLARPSPWTVCSPSRVYCALSDPQSWTTRAFRAGQEGMVLWSMPGWFRVAALADDGSHLVTGYDGMNILPRNARRDTVLLAFYRHGELIAQARLADVIEDFGSLEPTVTGLNWGYYVGFDARGRYVVETVERRRLAFDVTTGRIVASEAVR